MVNVPSHPLRVFIGVAHWVVVVVGSLTVDVWYVVAVGKSVMVKYEGPMTVSVAAPVSA